VAFDRQNLHITCNGILGTLVGGGAEIFSFGFRATGAPGFNAAGALAGIDVAVVAGLIGVYFGSDNLHLSEDATLTKVKVAAIGVDGMYLTDSVEAEPVVGGITGADAAVRHPNQVAFCVSLRSFTNLGHASRGRFFLPLPADGVNPSGKIDAARAVLRSSLTAELFTDLNVYLETGDGDDCNIALMSNIGAGTTHAVTKVRCGTVLDTIRSRRNALTEDYSADVVVT